jgi:peptide methionine sulfoxide reductase MsrA
LFFQNSEEEQDIIASRDAVKGYFDDPIVTEVVQLSQFFPAEGYHQDFYALNPSYGYCQVVIAPKMRKLGLEGVEKIAIPEMTGIQRTTN